MDLSVIAIIGILMLVGIVKKNAIMTTSFAAVFGVLPASRSSAACSSRSC
jgi:multidrug efflux pump subunit AcrB